MNKFNVLVILLASACTITLLFGACSATQSKPPQVDIPKSESPQSKPQTGAPASKVEDTSRYDEMKESLALYLSDYADTQTEKCNNLLSKIDALKDDLLDELLDYMDNIDIIDEVISRIDSWNLRKIRKEFIPSPVLDLVSILMPWLMGNGPILRRKTNLPRWTYLLKIYWRR